jgi:sulfite reductase (ferredoxin)
MFYTIPDTLNAEIHGLERKIQEFKAGQLDGSSLKVHRVPFGVYEQRKNNTFMVRIRCAGGAITPEQLRVVAELSQEYGAGTLHITTRQELQIHDGRLDDVVPIIRRLVKAGLSTRGGGGNTVRNITASADSGVSEDEVFDVSPHAFSLTSRLISESDSWLLPRKYKIAFSSSPKTQLVLRSTILGSLRRCMMG